MYIIDRVKEKPQPEETEPKLRLTYPQKWTSYNEAQTNEKTRFLELLYSLCQNIDDIPRKDGAGRSRIPFRDMIFAVVYKTYSGVSGRRFMSDLKDAHQKGFISTIPHFNSLFNYLDLEDMFYVLKELITTSALPLKAIEHDFAVDASGFSTGTRETWMHQKYSNPHLIEKLQWLKCHIVCGVLTNIVVSVEITDGIAGDSPQFKPLIENTAKHFEIKEVSADKAYLSVENLNLVVDSGGMPYIPFKENSTPTHYKKDKLWQNLYYFFKIHNDKFKQFYHKRSNVETTFYMIKRKFGERLKSKTEKAQINELLCKVLCHNLACVVHAIYEFNIDVDYIRD